MSFNDKQSSLKLPNVFLDEWVDGWMDVKDILRIAYSNQKYFFRGKLVDYPFQSFGKFLSNMVACPMCFSVWGGFFLSFVVWSPLNLILNVDPLFSWFFDGVLSSGVVWAINSIIEWFEENRPNSKN